MKKRVYELIEDLGFPLTPQLHRAKKDKLSGNNIRRKPKSQKRKRK